MHSTGSIIYTILERIHGLVNEAAVPAKFTNDYLVRHIVSPAMTRVLGRMHNSSSVRLIQKFTITLDPDQSYFRLPPCVQKVMRIVTVDSDGSAVDEVTPRDFMDWRGSGYRLEGNPGAFDLFIEARPIGTSSIEVWYVPNADSLMHYATDGSATSYVFSGTGATWDEATMTLTSAGDFADYVFAEGDTITISAGTSTTLGDYEISSYNEDNNSVVLKTSPGASASAIAWRSWTWYLNLSTAPTVGGVDRRENAYVGQHLTLLPSGATTRISSRLISEHEWNNGTWRVGLRTPVDVGAVPGTVTYEVAPPASSLLADAIACMGAQTLAAYRKTPRHGYDLLREELRISLKTLCDLATNFEGRKGHFVSRTSADRTSGYQFSLPE